MALYITNIAAMSAGRSLSNATSALNTIYQRLSSGLRINSAKDDPAGLQISNRLTSQIEGLKQGSRNASDGQALANTAEGALDEITDMLQRIRTLAIQSANGTNTTADRLAINAEVTELCAEITRISCRTTFGGAKILCGLANVNGESTLLNAQGRISIQVGADAYDTIDIDLSQGFALSSIAAGVGAQGGSLEEVCRHGMNSHPLAHSRYRLRGGSVQSYFCADSAAGQPQHFDPGHAESAEHDLKPLGGGVSAVIAAQCLQTAAQAAGGQWSAHGEADPHLRAGPQAQRPSRSARR